MKKGYGIFIAVLWNEKKNLQAGFCLRHFLEVYHLGSSIGDGH